MLAIIVRLHQTEETKAIVTRRFGGDCNEGAEGPWW